MFLDNQIGTEVYFMNWINASDVGRQPVIRMAHWLKATGVVVALSVSWPAISLAQTVSSVEKAPVVSAPASNASVSNSTHAEAPVMAPQSATDIPATAPAASSGILGEHDLSPWGMFQAADFVVKGVMIGLLLASIITWTIWLAKTIELVRARSRLHRELIDLKTVRSLNQASEQALVGHSFMALLIEDAQEELRLSSPIREKEGIKERVSFRLERLVATCGREMSKGTGVLATIGSTAPFVGLFGTVWGIMNSFIGIAKSQTTNLAVVAPGIAEALLATAIGLVAAIPAVVIYNVFARSIASYKALVADASAQVLLLVSRDLDHTLSPAPDTNTERNAAATSHVIKLK